MKGPTAARSVEARPTSSAEVCAEARALIDAGDPRGAQRTLIPIVRMLPSDPLPFRLFGEAFLRSGDAHRAERALAHAYALERVCMARGDHVERGTEAWLHRARSLKKTQSTLGYEAVADAVARCAPPASSSSGVREKIAGEPVDDATALELRVTNERRRARALEAQPTRRMAPPAELLDLATPEPPTSPPPPIVEASAHEIDVLVDQLVEESATPTEDARTSRLELVLVVVTCAALVASLLALAAALGLFR